MFIKTIYKTINYTMSQKKSYKIVVRMVHFMHIAALNENKSTMKKQKRVQEQVNQAIGSAKGAKAIIEVAIKGSFNEIKDLEQINPDTIQSSMVNWSSRNGFFTVWVGVCTIAGKYTRVACCNDYYFTF